jgi:hypothetical protein
MKTVITTKPKRRKVIDLPENVFHYLSIKAAANGQNLKNYIESLLAKDAEGMEDSATYTDLLKVRPEGMIMLDQQEKRDFEQWLEVTDR